MATLQPSEFCRYALTEQEEKRSKLLSPENIWGIQNKIAQAAKEKIELAATYVNFETYWQREAELQGEINALKRVLEDHQAVLDELQADSIEHPEIDPTVVSPLDVFGS